jgi:hypothetical protein
MNHSRNEETNKQTDKEAKVKGKGEIHPSTGRERPEGEYRYTSTLPLTSAAFLPEGERPSTHYTGRRMGSSAGLDGCGISRPLRDSIPGPSSL